MEHKNYSAIIIGSGIAGLYAAIKLAEKSDNRIALITKANLRESNSRYAQGGIVAVLPENAADSVELHMKDTVKAGDGLTDTSTAEFISQHSSDSIRDLIRYGVPFDKDENNNIALTLEAAHSVRRILHAGGDATGKSMEIALSDYVESLDNIDIFQKTQAVELLLDENDECKGLIAFNTESSDYTAMFANAVVIASGGAGQVYSNTTNPTIATGDGLAIAYRAGAVMQDMEFIQFHPTALTFAENGTRFLISESVRGEGARLKNVDGELFTHNYDERGDLAPRDVVTRAIFFEMQRTGAPHVYLDTSYIESEKIQKRFPNIMRVCKDHGIDILNDRIPVSPAAHYTMGGIQVRLNGESSIKGLYATGEAACTGLHGANRLASNSLLECVVISKSTSDYLNKQDLTKKICSNSKIAETISQYEKSATRITNLEAKIAELKETMWQNAGIVRSEASLNKALYKVSELQQEFNRTCQCVSLKEYEYRNMLIVAEMIVKSAISRKESRGAHCRSDFKLKSNNAYHSCIRKGEIPSSRDFSGIKKDEQVCCR